MPPGDLAVVTTRLQSAGAPHLSKVAAAIQASSDAIMIVDNQQRIEAVNPAFEQLTGLSASQAVGQDTQWLTGAVFSESEVRRLLQLTPGTLPGVPGTSEATIERSGSGRHAVEMAVVPFHDDSGTPSGIVYAFKDITERKDLDSVKDEFISRVSHEFRSPVTVIMGMASTLLRKEVGLPGAARSGVKDILTQTKRLNRFVDNLLIITRSRAGRLEIAAEYIRIEKLVSKVVKELGPRRGFSFQMDFPRRFPLIMADPVKLELVIRNLMDNAIKYSPKGGTIRLRGRQEESLVVISVEDQGLGIPAGHLDQIFQTFYHWEDPRLQTKPGIGLGLTACHLIVNAHGGSIWAESEPGKGTTFAFTLPREGKPD